MRAAIWDFLHDAAAHRHLSALAVPEHSDLRVLIGTRSTIESEDLIPRSTVCDAEAFDTLCLHRGCATKEKQNIVRMSVHYNIHPLLLCVCCRYEMPGLRAHCCILMFHVGCVLRSDSNRL